MLEHNRVIGADSLNISTELKSDKTLLCKENKVLQHKLDVATDKILVLTEEKVRLEGIVANHEKEVQSLRTMKWSRKIGATLLAVCGAIAPLFVFYWWSLIVYYIIVSVAVTSIFWGVWHSRIKVD